MWVLDEQSRWGLSVLFRFPIAVIYFSRGVVFVLVFISLSLLFFAPLKSYKLDAIIIQVRISLYRVHNSVKHYNLWLSNTRYVFPLEFVVSISVVHMIWTTYSARIYTITWVKHISSMAMLSTQQQTQRCDAKKIWVKTKDERRRKKNNNAQIVSDFHLKSKGIFLMVSCFCHFWANFPL